jgi:hypothetical protein
VPYTEKERKKQATVQSTTLLVSQVLVSSLSCTYPQHVAFIFYSRSRRKRHDDGKDEKEDGLDGSHCVCYGFGFD